MAYKGIDVGESNGTVDWDAIKSDGIQFAIIRIGCGSDGITKQDDPQAIRNMNECERLNIPYGVYIYSYALCIDQAHSEAQHMLRMIQGRTPQLGIWFDMEDADGYKQRHGLSFDSSNGQLWTDICITFCEDMKSNGYTNLGIYASKSPFTRVLDMTRLTEYKRWLALYYFDDNEGLRNNDVSPDDYENSQYFMWQYSSWGVVNGSSDRTDMNYFYGELSTYTTHTIDVTQAESMVISAYHTYLNREPDGEGFESWKNALLSGMAESTMIDTIKNSPEHINIIDSEITSVYNEVLRRNPDGDGLMNYRNAILNGSTIDDVKNALLNSDEYQNIIHTERFNYAKEMYLKYLGRGASDDEANAYIGMGLNDIECAIANSDEANNYRSALAQAEADKIAEQNRLAEEQRIAKIEKVKSDAQTELNNTLSTIDTSYYTVTKDENGLYILTENGLDDASLSNQQELNRVATKDAYDKYNSVILSLI